MLEEVSKEDILDLLVRVEAGFLELGAAGEDTCLDFGDLVACRRVEAIEVSDLH